MADRTNEIAITFFSNAVSKQAFPFTDVDCVGLIKGTGLKQETESYRLLQPGKKKDNAKKAMRAVCWSVSQYKDNHRLADNCIKHSGLICIDIDKLNPEKYQSLLKDVQSDPFTYICFTSPSGNGIKVVIRIEASVNRHLAFFEAIAEYYLLTYDIQIDASGKDVSRLCFCCYDPDIRHYTNSKLFEISNDAKLYIDNVVPEQIKLNTQQLQNLRKNTESTVNDVFEFTQNIKQYADARNNFVYLFACNCNRKGISQADAESFALTFAFDLDAKEVKASVNSAYKHHSNEHGKFAKKIRSDISNKEVKTVSGNTGKFVPAGNRQATEYANQTGNSFDYAEEPDGNQSTDSSDTGSIDFVKFWQTSTNEKTGKQTISLNYSRFYEFLEKQGYANLKIDNQNVELIHIQDNIVTPVLINNSRNDVKMQMNQFCKQNGLHNVLEMLHRGQDKYFARKQFINIGYRKVDFLKDEKDVSYHFHSNCVVEVRAEGIKVRDYSFGEKSLWASQVNPRPFTRVPIESGFNLDDRISADNSNCEFAKYQILASCHPNADVTADVANKRYLAHATSFGYLINNFKPVDGRAIVGVDHHKAVDKSEQNGRTGKGILSKAIGYVTKRFSVDGRKFDPKDQSIFEGLTMDSKVITVDDCHAKFDFGHFFVPLTEDFNIRKMYLGYITIPYDISPKWYFNTNFTFSGDGDSFSGRQHIIEFDNFFNKRFTPFEYFKHSLFREWDDNQWNLFFNYAYECDVLYKMMGLVDYAEGNYIERKLINECPQEFIDFVDAKDEQTGAWLSVIRDGWFEKKKLLELWNTESRSLGMNQVSAKLIYSMLKKYCQSKGIGFYTKKSNGSEVYWIGERMPVPMTNSIKQVVVSPNAISVQSVEQTEIF